MPRPRLEYEAMLRAEQERGRAERKWIEAMPAAALKPLWEKAKVSGDGGPAMLDQALARAVPQKDARILALFAWYGSGAGPWSGYPGYETIAEHVLLRYPTAELLHAAELRELTATETEGIARLFAGRDFSQARPHDLALLPADFRSRLWEHCLRSTDADKVQRARAHLAAP